MMAYDYSQYGGILVAQQDKVLTITLNSPETLNAFTGPMHTSMSRIWDDVNDDPDVHVVVLTGAGRAFSAGGNVIAMQTKIDDPVAWDAGMPEARRIVFRMLECDKPIIARVNGHAVGLGATIALLCDIIIAADHAKIGDPHVNAFRLRPRPESCEAPSAASSIRSSPLRPMLRRAIQIGTARRRCFR